MQQAKVADDKKEEAAVEVRFTDLPDALIACKVPPDLFAYGGVKVSAARRGF